MIERQILTAEEAEREGQIKVRIRQAVALERWRQRTREEVAFALCVARSARLVAAETERCAKVAEEFESDMGHGIPQQIADRIRVVPR